MTDEDNVQTKVEEKLGWWHSLSPNTRRNTVYTIVFLIGSLTGNGDRIANVLYDYVVSPDQFTVLKEKVDNLEQRVIILEETKTPEEIKVH